MKLWQMIKGTVDTLFPSCKLLQIYDFMSLIEKKGIIIFHFLAQVIRACEWLFDPLAHLKLFFSEIWSDFDVILIHVTE